VSAYVPYLVAAAALIGLALWSVVAHPNPLKRIIALNVMGGGVFMVLIAAAARGDGPPDAVPHALVLTGIVVAVATSALAIAIARTLHRTRDDDAPPADGSGPS
jgi:multicomponent Na+:H+ antiporter subunit C